jgi:GxxExxY protein
MNSNSTNSTNKLLYPELSYKIVGLLFNVHNNLGRFRNEKQYSDAIEQELKILKLPYKREFRLPESFKGENNSRNIIDFIIDDKIILEVKAKRVILKDDYFQIKRYLTSSDYKLGLLVNFRSKYLSPKRILSGNNL